MRHVFAFGLCAAAIAMVGCGTPEASNIMDGADQSDVQSYEEMVAADEAMMNEDPGDAIDEGTETAPTDAGTPPATE
jgi:hypothetical protein